MTSFEPEPKTFAHPDMKTSGVSPTAPPTPQVQAKEAIKTLQATSTASSNSNAKTGAVDSSVVKPGSATIRSQLSDYDANIRRQQVIQNQSGTYEEQKAQVMRAYPFLNYQKAKTKDYEELVQLSNGNDKDGNTLSITFSPYQCGIIQDAAKRLVSTVQPEGMTEQKPIAAENVAVKAPNPNKSPAEQAREFLNSETSDPAKLKTELGNKLAEFNTQIRSRLADSEMIQKYKIGFEIFKKL